MQAQAQAQAGADVAPQAKPALTFFKDAGGGILQEQVLHVPTTHNEMLALLSRRRQLSDQLTSVTERRDGIIEQMKESPQPAQAGLQAQLQVLDARVIQLETDLATTGREIAAASPQLIAMAQEPSVPPQDESFAQGGAAFGVPIFLVMSAFYVFQRRRWKKEARRSPPTLPAADSERLQRLENGMEAMAIEVERISEGQRFVTKLLTESRAVEPAPR